MATTTYMTSLMNCINDVKRETLSEVMKTLESKELLTDDIKEALTTMVFEVKTNKKTKKETKPRFSGYHLFMKDHRAVVKMEQPDIKPQELTSVVAKAWKEQTDEVKNEFNTRAAKLKEEYSNSSDATDCSEDEKKKPAKKEKPEKKEKPAKKEKKDESDDEEEITIDVEDAESDIDL